MATVSSPATSRKQLAAVGLALGLATLTFLVPLVLAALGITALVAFAAGAKALHLAHGLEPGSFSVGFYLATLLLLGAGGWQVVHVARSWLAQRADRKRALDAKEPAALVTAQPKRLSALLAQRPWMLLGVALFLVDAFLVRWEIRGHLDSPDGLLAASILASMVWAMIFLAALSVRLTGWLWRTLLGSSQRSPYTAGLVTAFSLAISLASGLALRSTFGEVAEAASHQNVVTSIEDAPTSESSLEQMRLALMAFAEPKKANEAQPLIRDAAPSPPPQIQPAAEPPTQQATEEPLAAAAFGAAGAGSAAALPSPTPSPDSAPAATPPIDIIPAAAAPTDSDTPFLGLTMGPPFASCVDRLTERTPDSDPIQRHTSRLAARFGISEHDARAIVIEALISVCMTKAEDREDLRRYFMRSVTNAGRNFVTRRLNGGRLCSIELVPVLDFPDESEGWHFAAQTEERAQKAFCELSELDQAIIQARVIEELKFGQIGEMIGLTEDGARKAFDRALRRMKQNFNKN